MLSEVVVSENRTRTSVGLQHYTIAETILNRQQGKRPCFIASVIPGISVLRKPAIPWESPSSMVCMATGCRFSTRAFPRKGSNGASTMRPRSMHRLPKDIGDQGVGSGEIWGSSHGRCCFAGGLTHSPRSPRPWAGLSLSYHTNGQGWHKPIFSWKIPIVWVGCDWLAVLPWGATSTLPPITSTNTG